MNPSQTSSASTGCAGQSFHGSRMSPSEGLATGGAAGADAQAAETL